jgi:hypothetical protein
MRFIDCSHISVNVVERILQVIYEYNMISKVFSITLGNASVMIELTPHLGTHVSGSTNASGLLH